MLLSQLTPWDAVLMPPPEVSDDELSHVPISADIRTQLRALLVDKRCPPLVARLRAIKRQFNEKIIDAARDVSLEGHITGRRKVAMWQALEMTANVQIEAIRAKVPVSDDDVNRLVERWMVLIFERQPKAERQVNGVKVVNGILKPTAGRPR